MNGLAYVQDLLDTMCTLKCNSYLLSVAVASIVDYYYFVLNAIVNCLYLLASFILQTALLYEL